MSRATAATRKRISLAGHSAGAYQAAMLALDRRYLTRRRGRSGDRPRRRLAGRRRPISIPSPKSAGATRSAPGRGRCETQPISFARADAPPILLMHGTADTVVRPYNSQRLAAKLKALGATAELRALSGQEPRRPRQVAVARRSAARPRRWPTASPSCGRTADERAGDEGRAAVGVHRRRAGDRADDHGARTAGAARRGRAGAAPAVAGARRLRAQLSSTSASSGTTITI